MAGMRGSDNRGVSMMELIVVISIMAVVVGIASLSVSMMFSRDAQRAATLIDDQLSEARMQSMSKPEAISLTVHTTEDPRSNTIELTRGSDSKVIKIDKNVQISLTSINGSVTTDPGDDIVIQFNKSNGKVEDINGANGIDIADDLFEIKVVSQRGPAKTVTVTLVSNTGRHYIAK